MTRRLCAETIGNPSGSGNFSRATRVAARISAAIVALLLTAAGVGAQTYEVLHHFAGSPDGAVPLAPLLEGTDGYFYGTTNQGGDGCPSLTGGCGVVFKMDAAGHVTILHPFVSGPSGGGIRPLDGLIQGADGDFYGTTFEGGADGLHLYGTAFKITADGVYTVLHTFLPNNLLPKVDDLQNDDPRFPSATVIQGTDGQFYGTASGGKYNRGTVFKLVVCRAPYLCVLHEFSGTGGDGSDPRARLVQASDGNFYGTTRTGGDADPSKVTHGTVFKVTPGGGYTRLHSFTGSDGHAPLAALIQGTDGYFYGTTSGGGLHGHGTVFRIDDSGNFTVMHSFTASVTAGGPKPVSSRPQTVTSTARRDAVDSLPTAPYSS